MRRLVATNGMSKNEWLLYRKTGITGTDAGAITGMNPYVSAFQVYQDKISVDIEDTDNEAMRQGRDMEEYVAARFTEATGLKVRRANAIFQNEDHPVMLADFDRILVGGGAGLECKTVSPYSADKWADGNIPLHYQMQVQHYLAVSGFETWYICALIFGKELVIRQINRDEELINYLITLEERFWDEHVMKHVIPDPDGTANCSKQIAQMYFHSDRQKTIQLNGFDPLLKRREELVRLIDKMDKEKAAIDQKIQLELGDAAYGVTDNYRVSWITADQRRLDTRKLKEEQPTIYDQYAKTSSCRRFTVKPAA